MKTKIIATLFGLYIVAQLCVPASMILSSEKALEKGRAFKFITAPVDPYDAFRGKYVELGFAAESLDSSEYASVVDTTAGTLSFGKRVYAVLEEDSIGFARIARLRTQLPADGYFVPAKINGLDSGSISVRFPFSKFFMEEGKAKRAEELYQQQNRAGKQASYAIVRVGLRGHAVIEDLVLGGVPVRDAVR